MSENSIDLEIKSLCYELANVGLKPQYWDSKLRHLVNIVQKPEACGVDYPHTLTCGCDKKEIERLCAEAIANTMNPECRNIEGVEQLTRLIRAFVFYIEKKTNG